MNDADLFTVSIDENSSQLEPNERLSAFYRAVEQSPSTVVITNCDGRIEYVNPRFTRLTGYSRSEAIGQNPSILKSGQMPSETYRDLWDKLKSGEEWCGELLNRKKDGSLFWEWASISPLTDENGQVTHFIAVKEDITQRKLAEQETRNYAEQQEILHRILSIALRDAPLDKLMRGALDAILSVSWLESLRRGGIFLMDANMECLRLVAHCNLSDQICRSCDSISLGHLLCGRAAANNQIVFADCVDERHDVRYDGMSPHGHYCVPIPGKDRAVGVLMIYLPEGHQRCQSEEMFLDSVVQTLATVIERKQMERDREALSRQLADVSRKSGMAEVATGILHNVGNVLNSVNVSANLLIEGTESSHVTTLQRASDIIEQHQDDLAAFLCNDDRGRHFPHLLAELAQNLAKERDKQLEEIRSLIDNIGHIKEIVTMQQAYARASGTTEPVNLIALIEDALRMADPGLARHSVQVVREFEDLPTVVTERHRVLQILVNLISNAKHALTDSDCDDRILALATGCDESGIFIQVRDNGVGISNENLSKVFSHGFTTRENGHGFGLHSSALVAQELGSSLSVHSNGAGHGATFTLCFPIKSCVPSEAPT